MKGHGKEWNTYTKNPPRAYKDHHRSDSIVDEKRIPIKKQRMIE
jgi:hypothetical protein